jgi:hypothetical protein
VPFGAPVLRRIFTPSLLPTGLRLRSPKASAASKKSLYPSYSILQCGAKCSSFGLPMSLFWLIPFAAVWWVDRISLASLWWVDALNSGRCLRDLSERPKPAKSTLTGKWSQNRRKNRRKSAPCFGPFFQVMVHGPRDNP